MGGLKLNFQREMLSETPQNNQLGSATYDNKIKTMKFSNNEILLSLVVMDSEHEIQSLGATLPPSILAANAS